jgi:hypothetical protein
MHGNPALQCIECQRELLVRGEHFPQLHEGSHDQQTHFHGFRAIQHIAEHKRSVLGKRVRQGL